MAAARSEENQSDLAAPGQALKLLLAGDDEAGLARYDDCLRRPYPERLPIGLHLLLIERAGRSEAAAALRDLALRHGGDVALKGVALGAPPAEAAAEYEALIARRIGNARMVFQYLDALAQLGRMEEVAAILDPDRLLRVVRLDLPAPGGGGLAEAVEALLLREEARAVDRDSVQPLSRMRMLEGLHQLDDPAARALVDALREQADLYLSDWAGSDHPLVHMVPGEFDLPVWGLIGRDRGFSMRHLHPLGWATGVYYPASLRDDGPGGELRIGPPETLEAAAGWPRAAIRPEAGMLVLMPSYYLHWTLPLEGGGIRLSVAFDAIGRTPSSPTSG